MTPQSSIKLAVDTAPFQHRFLTFIWCLFLILVERGLAQWGLFFDSTPLEPLDPEEPSVPLVAEAKLVPLMFNVVTSNVSITPCVTSMF